MKTNNKTICQQSTIFIFSEEGRSGECLRNLFSNSPSSHMNHSASKHWKHESFSLHVVHLRFRSPLISREIWIFMKAWSLTPELQKQKNNRKSICRPVYDQNIVWFTHQTFNGINSRISVGAKFGINILRTTLFFHWNKCVKKVENCMLLNSE